MHPESKSCRVCGISKPLGDFYLLATGKLENRCKACNKQAAAVWVAKNPDRRKAIEKSYRERNADSVRRTQKKYYLRGLGMDADAASDLLASQGGKCAICDLAIEGRFAHLDHDHATGSVRAYLCGPCNRGLGLFYDSPERLEKAKNYLLRYADV